jgi:hypothetical protein
MTTVKKNVVVKTQNGDYLLEFLIIGIGGV